MKQLVKCFYVNKYLDIILSHDIILGSTLQVIVCDFAFFHIFTIALILCAEAKFFAP